MHSYSSVLVHVLVLVLAPCVTICRKRSTFWRLTSKATNGRRWRRCSLKNLYATLNKYCSKSTCKQRWIDVSLNWFRLWKSSASASSPSTSTRRHILWQRLGDGWRNATSFLMWTLISCANVTSLPPAYCYCSCSLYCTLVLLRVTVLTSLYVITSQCTSGKLWRQSRSDDSLRRRWPACGPPWPAANTAVRPVSDVGAGVMSHGTGGPMTRACLTRGLTACSLSHTRSGS